MLHHYRYLIIGAGVASFDAVKGIRELDPQGSIALIGKDPDPPYHRPYLSKKLWTGKPFESVWLKMRGLNADLFLGHTATSLDPSKKIVLDDQGEQYSYEKLLISTGGTPRRLPFGGDHILYYRTLTDYRYLRSLIGKGKRFGIIGGGFIGSEVASSLTMNGEKVSMIFPEEGIGARIYPKDLYLFLNDYYRSKGVRVLTGQNIVDMRGDKEPFALVTDKGEEIPADIVIAGIGIIPNLDLPKSAGLQVEKGLIVDEMLRTSDPDIYAAGDITEFYQPLLAKRMRVEHEDNAQDMGRQAGRNMAGANEPYTHLSYFYSDMFDLGYEAVGELDPRMQTFEDWKEPFRKGVIYYLADGKVRGVLLWNVWDTVPAARELMKQPGPFTTETLRNRLG